MKNILLLICSLGFVLTAGGQTNSYWQQQVNYTIDVSLNDKDKSLNGFEVIQYENHSPDTLRFIWFHLWPNAYKNDKTAFSDQLLENGRKDFYFSNDDKRGYINRLDFKVDNITATYEDHPQHQDIIKLVLPTPLAPGKSITIKTPFHVKLPYAFSRSGYIGNSYQVTQWYPKPAVYDRKGWHEIPYLDQGEFYSEFGEYNVQITLPNKYVVAATGVLQEEKKDTATKTLRYKQDKIHDFAWFADPAFEVKHDTLQLQSQTIDVYAYYNKKNADTWKNSIALIKDAVRTKSTWVGEYPYKTVSVVEANEKGDGGMEYPTITLISSPGDQQSLDFVINHEVGHNWFYGILASNERLHPWMDEGMNSYYDDRYNHYKYGINSINPIKGKANFISKRMPDDLLETLLYSFTATKKDQPIETPSEQFSEMNYNGVAYKKTALWMELLEKELGKETFDKLMQEYYKRWQFKHPYPEDFKQLAEEISGRNLDATFALLHKKGDLVKPVKKGFAVSAFLSAKESIKKNYLFISPALGFNNYDKLMVGVVFHNYTLPSGKLQFVAAPLYATGSKQFNGIGKITYNIYPGNNGQKLELGLAAAKFSGDVYVDSTGANNYLGFSKIVPSARFVFANKYARSTMRKYIQWKTFFINETGLNFQRDTVRQLDIITYPVNHRYVNQLQVVVENNRTLYPYQAVLQADQGKGFVRLSFTGNYFFNFSDGGGMKVRFFAGKFFYTGDQTYLTQYETDPYHLNLSGPKGYEDYTYSNYYVGRNDFKYSLYDGSLSTMKNLVRGLPEQQIMERDGFFKVRTDLLSSKIGKTDNWLTAINFTTTIPKKVNPLALLPVKIPLKVFVDIGTYAEAWDKNSTNSRFLYDAGLQLSLFRNALNIYFPLLYSKVYKDYFKSTISEKSFMKNIAFSIDIQNISFRKWFPQIPF